MLGARDALLEESFDERLLEYPQYTRPAEFRGLRVPDVLLSGDHARVDRWRYRQRILRTARRRPDLLAGADLSTEDRVWLAAQSSEVEAEQPNDA